MEENREAIRRGAEDRREEERKGPNLATGARSGYRLLEERRRSVRARTKYIEWKDRPRRGQRRSRAVRS